MSFILDFTIDVWPKAIPGTRWIYIRDDD